MKRLRLTAQLRMLSVVVLLAACAGRAESAEALSIDVVILHHADLPVLTEEDEAATLAIAANMIRQGIDREVTFSVVSREDYAKFLSKERARIAPYRLDYFDIYEGHPADYRKQVIEACREFGTLEEVRLLLPEEFRAAVKDEESLAIGLLDRYTAALDAIKGITSKSGKAVVSRENWRDFAISDMDAILWSMDAPPRPMLYLSNTIIIDNNLESPAPHALVRGSAHGVAAPPSDRAIVAYQGHLLGDRRITGYPWKLAEKTKLNAIAFTIAHEVGIHLILHERDDYSPGALIARPITTTAAQLTEIDQWPKRESRERPLDMKGFRFSRHMLRLRIAVTRKEKAAADKEIFAILDLDVPNEWLESAAKLYEAAKWD